MSHLKGLLARFRAIVGARAADARMDEEFQFHVEMETRRLVDAGLSSAEARRHALLAFGGLQTHRETMRDERGGRWFDDLRADVRYALRGMRRAPAFAVAVAVTLGIGIGMNGLVYADVDALLFRPVPARDPGQLVALFHVDSKSKDTYQVGYQDYLAFRRRSGVFADLAAMSGTPLNLVVPWRSGSGDMVWGEMVSENFFTLLGMRPALGRFFTENDAPQGANPFAVLSYDAWKTRFGGDTSIIGKTVRLNGTGFTVTGVAPRGFKGMRTFGFWTEIWVPIGMHDVAQPGSTKLFDERGGGSLMVVGRMRPGSTLASTDRDARRFARQLALAYPATNETADVVVIPASGGFDDPSFAKPALMVLVSALGVFASIVTLIIICANLANLQLARAAARTHEIAIRLSLGCSRARLVRQMLVESFVLAIPGALIASQVLRLSAPLDAWMVPHLTFRVGFGAVPNVRVVAFTGAVALLAVVLFGLGPALKTSGTRSLSNLIGAHRTSAGRPSVLRNVLVVSQIALSVVLLVGATLFVRSLALERASDIGFDPQNRAVVSANIGLQNYDETRGRHFYDAVIARTRELPDVVSAAWAFPVPFDTYGRSVRLYVPGLATQSKDGTLEVSVTMASEAFVDALGLHLESGRSFTTSDSSGAPNVLVISRRLADRLWPRQDPIGQRVRSGSASGPEMTVVGVVANAKFESFGAPGYAHAYVPLRQAYRDWETLVVDTRGDPGAVIPRIKAAVAAVDPALPLYGIGTLNDGVANSLSTPRTAASVAGFFAALAMLISSVGLYGVVASGVSERTREIGVRVALGSTSGQVMRLVMQSGALLGLVGLAIGLAGAALVARTLSTLLYGLSPSDPVTFVIVPLALVVVVLVATFIPARHAVRLDPIAALRSD